jgi:hypothetical protein
MTMNHFEMPHRNDKQPSCYEMNIEMRSTSLLFQSRKFLEREDGLHVLHFPRHITNSLAIDFIRVKDELISGYKSPFGSFYANTYHETADLPLLIDEINSCSLEEGVKSIQIKNFPYLYSASLAAHIKECLLNANYTVKYNDTTQIIELSRPEMNLSRLRKRMLSKAEGHRLRFERLGTEHLPMAYSLIVESRKNKGYPITMTLKALTDVFNLFPEEYLLFGVFSEETMVAASVCIRVSDEILYSFYPGDRLAFRRLGSMTFMITELFKYASSAGYSLLDLGISTENGRLNEGLYKFKRSFGAVDCEKLTFEKVL